MAAIITDQIRILNAKNFVSGITTSTNVFYSFIEPSDMRVGIGACTFENPESHTGIGFNISTGDMRAGASITVYGIAYTQEIFMTKVFDNIVGLRDMTTEEQAQ